MIYNDFWLNTNTLIKQQNTTQRALALSCGFTERRIESLSSSARLPDAVEAVKIAQALGTTVEYLVTGEESNKDKQTLETIKTKLNEVLDLL